MKKEDFLFILLRSLIYKYSNIKKSSCKLLFLDSNIGKANHCLFSDLLKKVLSGDLLVLNDTKMILSRLYGYFKTGKSRNSHRTYIK